MGNLTHRRGATATLPRTKRRARCYLCGCLLAHDEDESVVVACSPCRVSRRDYNPATDPVFDRALEELFRSYPGVRLFPRLALGVAPEHKRAVEAAIYRLRRRGMHIAGRPHSGGYVYEPVDVNATGRRGGARTVKA